MITDPVTGIVTYETTDAISPLQTLLNAGQNSIINYLTTHTVQVDKVTASGTWTKPTGARFHVVEIVGGAGQGGGAPAAAASQAAAGSGGGSGAYLREWFNASDLSATEAVVVGAAGTGGAAGADGGDGGASTFKGRSVPGGAGGVARSSNSVIYAGVVGGAGGAVPTGMVAANSLALPGNNGGAPFTGGTLGVSGAGGASPLGAGGAQPRVTTASAQSNAGLSPAAGAYGAGGSGAITSSTGAAAAGGAGRPGIVIITTYF